MDIRAIIFDVNGTLIDIRTDEELEEIYRAIGHFLSYQGISMHRQEVKDLYFQIMQRQRANKSETFAEWDAVAVWREFLREKASDYTHALPAEKLAQIPQFLAELHRGIARKQLRLYPQVVETLERLHATYQMAIVSDAQSAYAIPELQTVGIRNYFDPIIVSGNYGYRKPDARLFQKALDALQVTAEQAVFIGNDLYRDIYGAQQVGMKSILITHDSPGQSTTQPHTVLPDYTIFRFADLPQAIKHFVDIS